MNSHSPLAPGASSHGITDGVTIVRKRTVSSDEAKRIGNTLGISWAKIDPDQFRRGLEVEFEHGAHDRETNVTNDDVVLTGKIAWAHLKEFPDYYTRLDRLEAEADAYWASAASRDSSYGREHSSMGIQEFVNKKLVRVASIDAPA